MAPLDWRKTSRFCAAAFLMDFGGSAFLVATPYLALRLGADSLDLGALGALWALAYGVGAGIGGSVADRLNRKTMAVASAFATGAAMAALVLVGSLKGLYAVYLLHAVALSQYWPAYFAWLGETHSRAQLGRATGAVNLSWSTGAIIGSFAGGLLYGRWGAASFLVAAAVYAVAGVCAATIARKGACVDRSAENDEMLHGPAVPREALEASWMANLAACCLIGLMGVVFPDLGQREFAIGPERFGTIVAGEGVMRSLIFLLGLWFGKALCDARLSAAVQLLAAGMVASVAWTHSPGWIAVVMLMLGVNIGVNYYRSLYNSLHSPERSGFKSGMHEGLLTLGRSIGAMGGGLIAAGYGLRAPYVRIGGFAVMLLALQGLLLWAGARRGARRRILGSVSPTPPPAAPEALS